MRIEGPVIMGGTPHIFLKFTPDAPKEQMENCFEQCFPFLKPVGAVNLGASIDVEITGSINQLAPQENPICDGFVSTIGEQHRLHDWRALLGQEPFFHGILRCSHDLWVLNPARMKLPCFRVKRDWNVAGRTLKVWDPIVTVAINGLFSQRSLDILLHDPVWDPEWKFTPLRTHEEENWAALLNALADADRLFGKYLVAIGVEPGPYKTVELWRSKLLPMAREIPRVQIE